MTAIIKLSQNEWVKFFLCKWRGGKWEWSFFCANGGNQSWQVWLSLRGKTKMVEFKMAAIRMNEFESNWISLTHSFLQNGWIQDGRIQDVGIQVEWEWMSLSQIELVSVKSQSGGRVFLSESERSKQGVWIQDGSVWIQHGRIQDGCHHQVESEWMTEGFFYANGGNQSWQVWMSLRGKIKMAESKMAKFKMAEFKMAAIIKLSENE